MEAIPPAVPSDQAMQDAEHIRLLVIFHYVWAGLVALIGFFPLIYVAMGFGMLGGAFPASPGTSGEELRIMGIVFLTIGVVGTLACWVLGVLGFFAGKFLSERRRPVFILVVSCINCINMPFGTALGVFTLIVTQRPTVKALFDRPDSALGSLR